MTFPLVSIFFLKITQIPVSNLKSYKIMLCLWEFSNVLEWNAHQCIHQYRWNVLTATKYLPIFMIHIFRLREIDFSSKIVSNKKRKNSSLLVVWGGWNIFPIFLCLDFSNFLLFWLELLNILVLKDLWDFFRSFLEDLNT